MSNIELRVKTLVAALAKVPVKKITSESDLRKLGIDSLMALELIANLERAFRVHIPEGKIRGIARVDQIVNAIAALQKSAAQTGRGGLPRTRRTRRQLEAKV